MQHECRYYPTVMSGPVIRFEFGYDRGPDTGILAEKGKRDWSAEISASRDGVSMQGDFPIYGNRDSIDHIKRMLDWAWDAHQAIGERGDHDAAKDWVRTHNATLTELREIVAEKLST